MSLVLTLTSLEYNLQLHITYIQLYYLQSLFI